MQANITTAKYLLELVEQDISILETQRADIIERFLTTASWSERDVNHGQLLALAKVRGRLQAMIEISSWNTNNDTALQTDRS